MFTFSFSTAMAATTTEAFDTAVAAYKGALTYDGNGYIQIKEADNLHAAWDKIISKTVLETAIDNWAANVDLNAVDYVANGTLNTDATNNMKEAIKEEVNSNQYDIEMGKLNDLIASIDLTAYNSTGKTALENAIVAAEDAVVDAPKQSSGIKKINTAISTLKTTVTNNKVNLKAATAETIAEEVAELEKHLDDKAGDYYAYAQDYFNATTLTVANEVAAKATFDADFNALVDFFAECIDRYEAERTAAKTLTATSGALKADINYYFYAGTTNTPVNGAFQNAKAKLAQRDVWVAYYEKAAEVAKETVNADGTKTYYNVDIDNLLADTLDAVEKDLWTAIDSSSATAWGTAAATEWAKLTALANATYDLQAYRASATDKFTTNSYDDANWAGARKTKVTAIQKEYAEKVLLAGSIDEIDALVKEAKSAIDAIMTSAEVNAVAGKVASRIKAAGFLETCTVTTDGKGKIATATGDGFDSYFRVVIGSTSTYKATIKTDALKAAAQVFVDAVLAEEDDDITYKQIDNIIAANKDAAYAKLADVRTTAELKSEAAAVTVLINELPKTVTVDAKAQVLDAQAAMDAYVDNAGASQTDVSKYGTLKSALTSVINAESREVAKLIRALPITGVSVADAEEIAAARAAYKALKSEYGDYIGTEFTTATLPSVTRLENAEAALENAKLVYAAKLITALTTTSTDAEVDAAKAAFDALETEKKLALNDELYNKLMNAVEASNANDVIEKISSVESLKIKASSTKGKGWIKVQWKVTGNAEAADGYQLYKSTKAQTGYKKCITTTKTSFKNTKNIKSGTRYYYKVRAFVVVDGVTYYSDWSNKANRVAK